MPSTDPHSLDLTSSLPEEDIHAVLARHFPSVIGEGGRVDPARLKQALGDSLDTDTERYGLSWAGKSACFEYIQSPTTATLHPCPEASVDWDTTRHTFIEGENATVLKVLRKAYHRRVKMVYIDPPYNTGEDSFIYPDRFAESREEYIERTGMHDDEGDLTRDGWWRANSRDNGHYHSNWLSMMYPRLYTARQLLRDDGVIFVSIDDHEVHNLRCMMNEIFGEENFVAEVVWQKKRWGWNDAKHIAIEHEYVLLFARNIEAIWELYHSYSNEYLTRYSEEDESGKFFWDTFKRKSGKQYYPIACPDGTVLEYDEYGNKISWLRSEKRYLEDVKIGEIKFERHENGWSVFFKQRLPEWKTPRSILQTYGTTSSWSTELLELFQKNLFQNPKPVSLIGHLLSIGTTQNDLILDFFAGSGTTAHAVMALNADEKAEATKQGADGSLVGNRRYICVQMAEPCATDSEAYRAGYATIADIARERIRRAGARIRTQSPETDTGFRAYRLGESNFKVWRPRIRDTDDLIAQMADHCDTKAEGSTETDMLTELLIRDGRYDLTTTVETRTTPHGTYYRVGDGRLAVYLGDDFTRALAEAILADSPERIVCLDRAFRSDDQLKTNILLQAEQRGVEFKVV